jgi:protein-S-isoprenylcysteine O-methyltransferase Ste14
LTEESAGMIYIVLGVLGFLAIHLLDIVSIKRIPLAKPLTMLVGNGLLVFSIIMLCLSPDKLTLPAWSSWLGWVLLPISLFLIIYSLFIKLPFGKSYVTTGVGDRLITSGLYALVRHPWVHGLVLMLVALVLVSQSRLMLIAAPIWVLLDIGLVAIQDRFFLGRMFADYDNYRRRTPMLIPNRRSLSAFINSLKQTGS